MRNQAPRRCIYLLPTLALVLLAPQIASAHPPQEFEGPPLVPARDLAPSGLIAGNGFWTAYERVAL
jgi:hypothetical protein